MTVFSRDRALRVGFVVNDFPVISETFIINQVTDLIDRDISVEIFAFSPRDPTHLVARKYHTYNLAARTHYLGAPAKKLTRLAKLVPTLWNSLLQNPAAVLRSLNLYRFGREALTLRLLYIIQPFLHNRVDIIHCHTGVAANRFLRLQNVLRLKAPVVTSFYGYDVSATFRLESQDYYAALKQTGALFFVMSADMRKRVIEYGFPAEKVLIHPVSIDVGSYPFAERRINTGEIVQLISVARFVEKKGLDDLVRALAIVRDKGLRFHCTIVGSGPLEIDIRRLISDLSLDSEITLLGYKQMDEVIQILLSKHIFVQPSKTAKNGDME